MEIGEPTIQRALGTTGRRAVDSRAPKVRDQRPDGLGALELKRSHPLGGWEKVHFPLGKRKPRGGCGIWRPEWSVGRGAGKNHWGFPPREGL